MNVKTPRPYVIVTGDYVRTGGMDRANYALAEYLANTPEKASSVHLVGHRCDSNLLDNSRVHFHKVPQLLKSYWLSGPFLNNTGRNVAKRLAGDQKPVLVVNGGNCRSPLVNLNWVHYVHAAFDPCLIRNYQPRFHQRLKMQLAHRDFLRHERIAFRQPSRFIANSRLTAQHLQVFYGVDPKHIDVVYYGTDQHLFQPVTADHRHQARESLGFHDQDDRPNIVFVGALGDSRKGFDLLFQAWRRLNDDSSWDTRLIVVGSGSSLNYYQHLAEREQLGDSIRFLGFRRDVPEILASSDLLVSPARYEAYGLNVHEALCRGLPVLVSSTAGIAERIRDYSDEAARQFCLPDPLDADSLCKSLQKWRQAVNSNRHLAEEVGQYLSRDSWARQMQTLVETDH